MSVAYPIGCPIASNRANPNRPRIARVVSCRVVPSGLDRIRSNGDLRPSTISFGLGQGR